MEVQAARARPLPERRKRTPKLQVDLCDVASHCIRITYALHQKASERNIDKRPKKIGPVLSTYDHVDFISIHLLLLRPRCIVHI